MRMSFRYLEVWLCHCDLASHSNRNMLGTTQHFDSWQIRSLCKCGISGASNIVPVMCFIWGIFHSYIWDGRRCDSFLTYSVSYSLYSVKTFINVKMGAQANRWFHNSGNTHRPLHLSSFLRACFLFVNFISAKPFDLVFLQTGSEPMFPGFYFNEDLILLPLKSMAKYWHVWNLDSIEVTGKHPIDFNETRICVWMFAVLERWGCLPLLCFS